MSKKIGQVNMFRKLYQVIVFIAVFISAQTLSFTTFKETVQAAVVECDTVAACNTAIANAQSGDTINLTADLLSQAAGINFNARSGITFDGNNHILEGNGTAGPGIILTNTAGTTIKNMIVRNWRGGFSNGSNIYINSSSGNTFENIISSGSGYSGFYLNNSSNNIIRNSESSSNTQRGFIISGSNFNTITDNLINGNSNVGIFIGTGSSSDNTIKNNRITNNGNEALYFYSTFGSSTNYRNKVYNNYFSNTFRNVNTSGIHSTTEFNTALTQDTNIVGGPYIGGNYWGNPSATGFSQNCVDADANGICDAVYTILGSIIDNYPITDFTPIGDTEKPVITLNGPTVMDIEFGNVYTEMGAIWTDNIDGSGVAAIGGDVVDTNTLGTYLVTYNYVDQAGNAADQITRTVNVADSTAPVITLLGTNPVTVEANSIYSDAGVTAVDNHDGDITASVITNNTVNTTLP